MGKNSLASKPCSTPETPGRNTDVAAIAIFLLVCAVILWHRGYRWGDDDWFLEWVRNESFHGFLVRRYAEWSSRTGIEAVIALTIEHLWLWRLLNGLVLGGMLWVVTLYFPAVHGRSVIPLWCAGFFLLDPQMLHWTVWWVTGSYNYFWPAVAALLALLPFFRPGLGKWFFLLAIPAAVFAGFNEQVVLLMLGFQLVLGLVLWRDGRLTGWHWVQLVLCLLVLVFVLASPGVKLRYVVELRWMPGFESLGLGAKLVQGLDNYFSHVFVASNVLTGVWLLMLAWLVPRLEVGSVARYIVLAVLGVYVLALLAPWVTTLFPHGAANGSAWARWLTHTPAYMPDARVSFSYSLLDAGNRFGFAYWGRFTLYAGVWCSAIFLTFLCLRTVSIQRALLAVVMMAAAALAATIVGLSPTIYGSGARVFLFGDFLLLLVCCMLYQAAPRAANWPLWFSGVVCVLAINGVVIGVLGGTP